jgi:hypothetical protein
MDWTESPPGIESAIFRIGQEYARGVIVELDTPTQQKKEEALANGN